MPNWKDELKSLLGEQAEVEVFVLMCCITRPWDEPHSNWAVRYGRVMFFLNGCDGRWQGPYPDFDALCAGVNASLVPTQQEIEEQGLLEEDLENYKDMDELTPDQFAVGLGDYEECLQEAEKEGIFNDLLLFVREGKKEG